MVKIYPSVLKGSIKAPASKSHALRLLCAAAMPATATTIKNVPICKDVETCITALETLGCKITQKADSNGRLTVKVEPFPKTTPVKIINFNFKDSATTARFLTAISAAFGIQANCRVEGSLGRRSQISLTSRMAIRGAKFSSFSYPFTMGGRLLGGDYELPGDEGSQFISALLLALPCVKDDSFIKLTSDLVDSSFIDLTIDVLKTFHIKCEKKEDGFFIPGSQYYKSPGTVTCENDWGLASMWTTAAAAGSRLGSSVSVSGLNEKSHQMYRTPSELFSLICQDFKYINIDAKEYPNLASLFAALAVAKGGSVRIDNVPQLKYKESHRLRSIGQAMERYGVQFKSDENGFTVTGKNDADYPDGMTIDCLEDSWIFMSLALASVAFKKPIILNDEKLPNKIYGNFLKDFTTLGGKYEII